MGRIWYPDSVAVAGLAGIYGGTASADPGYPLYVRMQQALGAIYRYADSLYDAFSDSADQEFPEGVLGDICRIPPCRLTPAPRSVYLPAEMPLAATQVIVQADALPLTAEDLIDPASELAGIMERDKLGLWSRLVVRRAANYALAELKHGNPKKIEEWLRFLNSGSFPATKPAWKIFQRVFEKDRRR